MPISAPKLVVDDLSAGYGAVRVLDSVSLTVAPGETVALLGTSGNGKSTLINSIMGLVRPSGGAVYLDGGDGGARTALTGLRTEAIADLGLALVPEGRRLFPKSTVEENLLLGAYRRDARGLRHDRMAECLDAFPALKQRRRQLAGSMSGGEQQMLALARALMSAPRILLIDEPSVGLAPILVARMIDTIASVKERYGLSVLMAEQNFHQAVRISDRGYVLVHGQIAFEGRTADELRNSELVKTYYLGT
ncbi:MAG TPA: ABC transporter ATP-binding protein [Stellaceae bacterium]